MPHETKPLVVCDSSIAWTVNRVVGDAVKDGRLSETEAAVIYDFVWRSAMPDGFKLPENDGGFKREARF